MVLVVHEDVVERDVHRSKTNEGEGRQDSGTKSWRLEEAIVRNLPDERWSVRGKRGRGRVAADGAKATCRAYASFANDLCSGTARVGLPVFASASAWDALGMFTVGEEVASLFDNETMLTNAAHGLSAAKVTLVQGEEEAKERPRWGAYSHRASR